jgi:hypothetical protein
MVVRGFMFGLGLLDAIRLTMLSHKNGKRQCPILDTVYNVPGVLSNSVDFDRFLCTLKGCQAVKLLSFKDALYQVVAVRISVRSTLLNTPPLLFEKIPSTRFKENIVEKEKKNENQRRHHSMAGA